MSNEVELHLRPSPSSLAWLFIESETLTPCCQSWYYTLCCLFCKTVGALCDVTVPHEEGAPNLGKTHVVLALNPATVFLLDRLALSWPAAFRRGRSGVTDFVGFSRASIAAASREMWLTRRFSWVRSVSSFVATGSATRSAQTQRKRGKRLRR
jgi:hypothetical protein